MTKLRNPYGVNACIALQWFVKPCLPPYPPSYGFDIVLTTTDTRLQNEKPLYNEYQLYNPCISIVARHEKRNKREVRKL